MSTRDYFIATLQQGELIMEPHCSCGEVLEEEYLCEKCKRHCQCLDIRCKEQKTMDYVVDSLKDNPDFGKFQIFLDPK